MPSRRKIIAILLFSITLQGCQFHLPQNTQTDTPVPIAPTETVMPTSAILTHIPEMTATPIQNDPIDYGIYDRCGNLISDIDQFPQMSGKLYLAVYDRYQYTTLDLIDLNTFDEQTILNENFGGGNVSTDGNLFSYVYERDNTNDLLITLDSTGSIVDEYIIDKRFYGFEWLNNETILFNFVADEMPVFLYSPITREQRIIQSYKGNGSAFLYLKEPMRDWGPNMYHRNVHNAQLTRLLYPTLTQDEYDNTVIIRDVETGTDLVEIPTNFRYGVWPSWSPDGEFLAIAINTNELMRENWYNQFEIFLYDQDGRLINKTNLLSLSRSVEIHKLFWSPNNQFIFFTYFSNSYGMYSDTKYGIWDTKGSRIYNYCLPEGAFFSGWSSDNKFLLFGVRGESFDETDTYILDISSGDYFLIKKGFVPIGWLN